MMIDTKSMNRWVFQSVSTFDTNKPIHNFTFNLIRKNYNSFYLSKFVLIHMFVLYMSNVYEPQLIWCQEACTKPQRKSPIPTPQKLNRHHWIGFKFPYKSLHATIHHNLSSLICVRVRECMLHASVQSVV